MKKFAGCAFRGGLYRLFETKDTVENLEISDMEVYWGILGQLMD